MNLSEEYIAREQEVSAHNYHPLPVVIREGKGVWVTDVEGRRYLDMLSAYSALNMGHCHPTIIAAATEQMSRLTLTSRAFHNDQMVRLLEKLSSMSGFSKGLLMNSGAEAVETAIKAMRRWGYETKGVPDGKAEIIVMSQNFHGRTSTIISFSSDEGCRKGYGPYATGFKTVPFDDLEAVREAFTPYTVGVLTEPIQGEAGVVIPSGGFLAGLRKLCDEHQVLLAIDEIQTGFGRTGALFCYQHEGIKPDIVIIGKALGGGVYPVSGILADDLVMDVAFTPGSHGSTFGGNPLASAVALAALQVLEGEELVAKSAKWGTYFMESLIQMQLDNVQEVRGQGLMIAIQLHPDAGKARPYTEAMLERGLLAKETHDTIIRFAPPLIISRGEIDQALSIIKEVLS